MIYIGDRVKVAEVETVVRQFHGKEGKVTEIRNSRIDGDLFTVLFDEPVKLPHHSDHTRIKNLALRADQLAI